MKRLNVVILLSIPLLTLVTVAQTPRTTVQRPVNYDEGKVAAYTLPDPLLTLAGRKITNSNEWRRIRRPEVVHLFESEVYGKSPGRPGGVSIETVEEDGKALGGKATRRQLTIHLSTRSDGPQIDVLMYLPNGAKGPVPAFLGLNFDGNQTIHTDPGIRLSRAWVRENPKAGIVNNRGTEASRGASASRWQAEKIIAGGFALVTACYGDIDPDFDDGFKNGVHPLFSRSGQTRPGPDEWGSLAAWSWGLSRILDYLEKDGSIDARHVAVLGHSRLGKAALWAGALDERFAIVISNDSGCGGAALSRRDFGETVERINTSFPHWFCANFKKYNNNESALPVDQHMLIALVAPRPVYVASAAEDLWADPRGEFLSAKHAEPVYRLFGRTGLGVDDMPAIDHPVGDFIGYHIRTGKHDVTAYDWERYIAFAERHFRMR